MGAETGGRGGEWDAALTQHRQRQLLRIGRAAAELAVRNGLSAVSMSELARALGLSRATLYNYVPDVATAIRLHLAAQAEVFGATVTAAIAEESGPEAQLRRYVREQVSYLAGADHRAALALAEAGPALGGSASAVAHERRHPAVLEEILDRGVAAGTFGPVDRVVLATLITRLLYSAQNLLDEHHLSPEDATAAISALILDGIRPARRAPAR